MNSRMKSLDSLALDPRSVGAVAGEDNHPTSSVVGASNAYPSPSRYNFNQDTIDTANEIHNLTPVKNAEPGDTFVEEVSGTFINLDHPNVVKTMSGQNRNHKLSAALEKARDLLKKIETVSKSPGIAVEPIAASVDTYYDTGSTESGDEVEDRNGDFFLRHSCIPNEHISTQHVDGVRPSTSRDFRTHSENDEFLARNGVQVASCPSSTDQVERAVDNGIVENHQPFFAPAMEMDTGTNDPYEAAGHQKRNKSVAKLLKMESKVKKMKESHDILPPCAIKCSKGCRRKISAERRADINEQFWNLGFEERSTFVYNHVEVSEIKIPSGARSQRFQYYLRHNGQSKEVCRTFFLTTLGLKKNNNTLLKRLFAPGTIPSRIAPIKDQRGKKGTRTNKVNHEMVERHIRSFNPCISHYRRKHAPNRLYLSSEMTIRSMHALFEESHPTVKCSYFTYRDFVNKMNISFAKLGHEECGVCEEYYQHDETHVAIQKEGTDEQLIELNNDCETCRDWIKHKKHAKEARQLYVQHSTTSTKWTPKSVCFSADLQKVIMLPRMESFKEVLFTRRIIAFNESFVPVGEQSQPWLQPLAVVWHEACAGRKKEEIISSFHAFFLSQRDADEITLWVDNCAAQNKNWTFFTYLVFIINSDLISAKTITVNYFEPGHTFMSADSFHHQVETQMKVAGKVYDFEDFKNCISKTCKGKVAVKEMGIGDFFEWEDRSSKYKLGRMDERPYLSDIVKVKAERGKTTLLYSKTHSDPDEFKALDFLMKKKVKKNSYCSYCNSSCSYCNSSCSNNNGNMNLPLSRETMRGIPTEKKNDIISKLLPLMPPHKRLFWVNLPNSEDARDLVQEDEEDD